MLGTLGFHFIDLAATGTGASIQLEEILVPMFSQMAGKALRDLEIANRFEVMIVAIRHAHTDEVEFNPRASSVFQPEDVLIVMGPQQRLLAFERALRNQAP